MSHGQDTYRLDCEGCGIPVTITNPRTKEFPTRVRKVISGLRLSDRVEVVRTRCLRCGKRVIAKLDYEREFAKPW
jgi:hypothetical protein